MANSELLSYVKQVMDLETSVYTNQSLQDGFSSSMAAQAPARPQKPEKKVVSMPLKPEIPTLDKNPMLSMLVFCGIGAVFTILGIFSLALGDFLSIIMGLLWLIIGVPIVIGGAKHPGEVKKKTDEYNAAVGKYNAEMDVYKKHSAEAETRNQNQEQVYQSKVAVYRQNMASFTDKCEKSRESIVEAGNNLKNTLEQVYSVDVIYPKYRNLVAVTMIYEYLASGRCSELEGPNGAYNLYEMELRQNIIIGQLSSILDRLEQIRSNQFTLYNELEKSNQESARLLSDISNNVEFNRYASEETAKANAAIAQNTEATKYYTLFNAAKRK